MLITPVSRAALAALSLVASGCALEGEPVAAPAVDHAALSAVRPTVRDSIRTLTAKGPETLEQVAGPSGTQLTVVREGHAEVLVAKKNADGTVSRRCVGSPGEGDAFLGETPVKVEVTKAADR